MLFPPVAVDRVAIGHPDADAGVRIEFLPLQRTETLHRRKIRRRFDEVRLADPDRKPVRPGQVVYRAEALVVVADFRLLAPKPGQAQVVADLDAAQRKVHLDVAEEAVVLLHAPVFGTREAAGVIDPEAVQVEEHVLDIFRNLHVFHPFRGPLVTEVQAHAAPRATPVNARRNAEGHGGVLVAQILVLGHQRHVVIQVEAQRPVPAQREPGTRLHRIPLQRERPRNGVGQHERRLVGIDPSPPRAAPAIVIAIAETPVQAHRRQRPLRLRRQRAAQFRSRIEDILQIARRPGNTQRHIHIRRILQHQPRHVVLLRSCRPDQQASQNQQPYPFHFSLGLGVLSGMKSASELFVSMYISMPSAEKSSRRVTHLPE